MSPRTGEAKFSDHEGAPDEGDRVSAPVEPLASGFKPPHRTLLVAAVLASVMGGGLVGASVVLRHPAEGPRIGPNVPATAMDERSGIASNSPALLTDPTNDRFLVLANRVDAPDYSCALQLSGDGGKSWAPADPVPTLPDGADKCYAPEVAFGRDGRLYYLFVGLAGTGNSPMGVFLTSSSDRGRTFAAPRQVLGPLNFSVRMAIDAGLGRRGRLHLVWLHATSTPGLGAFGPPPNPILAAHSDDGGATFSDPVQVSDANRQRVVAAALALGPHHAVSVGYYDLGNDARDYQGLEGPTWEGPWSVVVSSSSDGGDHFGTGVPVSDTVIPFERVMLIFTMPPPSMVAVGGRLCVAWADSRNGDADALLRCSEKGGKGWGHVKRLNDDPRGNGLRQYLPRISASPNGRIDAIFYDRRRNPQNIGNDIFYTYSDDGGRHFSHNVVVDEVPSDSRIGQFYRVVSSQGLVEFGARLGLASGNDDIVAAWTDTRNSKRGTSGQDVFVARVQLAKSRQAWMPAAGVVLMVLGVAAGAWARRRRHRPSATPSQAQESAA